MPQIAFIKSISMFHFNGKACGQEINLASKMQQLYAPCINMYCVYAVGTVLLVYGIY